MRRRVATASLCAAAVCVALGGQPAVAVSAPATGVRVDRDVTYREVDGQELELDVYLPLGRGRLPAVVLIHGGGWVIGSKDGAEVFATPYLESGFAVFAINYRLAPAHPYPAAAEDVRAAVEWVRSNAVRYGVDPARIGAFGGSAGGHLAGLLATMGEGGHDRGARVAAAVSWAGPMNLQLERFPPAAQLYVASFLGCSALPCNETMVAEASPITHVDASDAPLLLVQGDADQLVPLDQAERMAAALASVGAPHELLVLPGVGHDPSLLPPATQPSVDFMRAHLGGPEPSPFGVVGQGGLLVPAALLAATALVVGGVLVAVGRAPTRRRARQRAYG